MYLTMPSIVLLPAAHRYRRKECFCAYPNGLAVSGEGVIGER
jgi:hypothetical protein